MYSESHWEKLTSLENLFTAFHNASKGKRSNISIADFEFDLEENIFSLREALISGTYQHGPYHSFYIHDPKKRLISAANFRDRVVHHALVQVIEPLFERQFIYDTYANRVGKGTHRALDRCTQFLRSYPYYLQLDIRQYFPSIDHQVMMHILKSTIKDPKVLDLCALILNSGTGILSDEYQMAWFRGDDLLAACRPRGLPIGNMTSQFWANVYLNPIDQFIKRVLKCKATIRYVDDILLFGRSKQILHQWKMAVMEELAKLRLTVHFGQARVAQVSQGLTFLGFRLYPDHRRLKREKVIHARRHLAMSYDSLCSGKISRQTFDARIKGWINHARYGDTWGLRVALLQRLGIAVDL